MWTVKYYRFGLTFKEWNLNNPTVINYNIHTHITYMFTTICYMKMIIMYKCRNKWLIRTVVIISRHRGGNVANSGAWIQETYRLKVCPLHSLHAVSTRVKTTKSVFNLNHSGIQIIKHRLYMHGVPKGWKIFSFIFLFQFNVIIFLARESWNRRKEVFTYSKPANVKKNPPNENLSVSTVHSRTITPYPTHIPPPSNKGDFKWVRDPGRNTIAIRYIHWTTWVRGTDTTASRARSARTVWLLLTVPRGTHKNWNITSSRITKPLLKRRQHTRTHRYQWYTDSHHAHARTCAYVISLYIYVRVDCNGTTRIPIYTIYVYINTHECNMNACIPGSVVVGRGVRPIRKVHNAITTTLRSR